MTRSILLTIAGLAALTTACSDRGPQPQAPDAATSPAWLLATEPADAVGVTEAKAAASEGDRVVVRGRIGGRAQPISADSPVFVVMDLALPHCGQNAGDTCPTPWDYCCETPETITANAATVQVVDAQGNPVSGSPAGQLAALDEVILVGTVGPRPSPGVLTVRATGVYRAGR